MSFLYSTYRLKYEQGRIMFYFTNDRYIDCLSLTYATNKNKTQNKKKKYYTVNKKQKT